ncbi:MAG: sulfatase [Lentisphaeraceae bacterium]|nr:sulfatase [Lentisphaeraceae bacterium]
MLKFFKSFIFILCLSSQAAERPNVLFIAIDDLNDWVGCLGGNSQAITPHIDQLASRGTLFTNAHCAAPACNPSRTSVLTGISPATSGVYLNWQDWRQANNLKGIITLPEHFKNNGYKVVGGGKVYHAASLSPKGFTGLIDGDAWDEYFPSKNKQLAEEVLPEKFPLNGSKKFYRGFFDWAPLEIEDDEMGDAKVVSWAEKKLAKKHDKPLFMAVGIYRPHIPWYTPKSHFDKFPNKELKLPDTKGNDLGDVPELGKKMARRSWQNWMKGNGKWQGAVQAYLASMHFTDTMVGRLLKALDNGPMADNTVVVLWSDHGYHLGHKEHWEKFTLWEQATRVPLIVMTPGNKSGEQVSSPVSLLDIYPTLADACGLNFPKHLEGVSLLKTIASSSSDRAVVTTQGRNNHAVRSKYWRYIKYEDGTEELYDHRVDPKEYDNVAALSENKEVIQSLSKWLPKLNAPMHPPLKSIHK